MKSEELRHMLDYLELEAQHKGPSPRGQSDILLGIWRTQIAILERLEKLDKVLGDGITLKAKNIYGPN